MNRDTVLKLLSEHREEVRERYGARRLALFLSLIHISEPTRPY